MLQRLIIERYQSAWQLAPGIQLEVIDPQFSKAFGHMNERLLKQGVSREAELLKDFVLVDKYEAQSLRLK